jgi:hypothetical protein
MNDHGYCVYQKIKEKKLTSANSLFIDGLAFYIVKKWYDDKPARLYCAYLYPSGIQMACLADKNKLKEFLSERTDRVKEFMIEYDVEGISL